MTEQYVHAVETLLATNFNFKRLYDKHSQLDEQVNAAYEGDIAVDEMSLEKMKKEKLYLKDQMERMIMEFIQSNQAVA